MVINKFLLSSCLMLLFKLTSAQMPEMTVHLDSVPRIRSFKAQLPILDKLRAVAYLFTSEFHIVDSLNKIYIDLYNDSTFNINNVNNAKTVGRNIFQFSYKVALLDRIEYIITQYTDVVVTIGNKKGDILFQEYFPIKIYNFIPPTRRDLDRFIKSLRVPATWNLVKTRFATHVYCMKQAERIPFYRCLLYVLKHVGFIEKRWREWIGFFPDCDYRADQQFFTLKLPK